MIHVNIIGDGDVVLHWGEDLPDEVLFTREKVEALVDAINAAHQWNRNLVAELDRAIWERDDARASLVAERAEVADLQTALQKDRDYASRQNARISDLQALIVGLQSQISGKP